MLIFTAITILSVGGAWATPGAKPGPAPKSEAQVLVTARGEPAPFPHFPSVAAVPAVPPEQFEFAPTPNGRPLAAVEALPNSPELLADPILPEVPQSLGKFTT